MEKKDNLGHCQIMELLNFVWASEIVAGGLHQGTVLGLFSGSD